MQNFSIKVKTETMKYYTAWNFEHDFSEEFAFLFKVAKL